MISKACKKCGVVKPLEAFPTCKRTRDGREGRCRACQYAYQVAWQAKRDAPLKLAREMERAAKRLVTEKTCAKCGCVKPLEDFHATNRCLDGRVGRCKQCESLRWSYWNRENPEAIAEARRRHEEEHPRHWIPIAQRPHLKPARVRARRKYLTSPNGSATWKASRKAWVQKLADGYVRQLLAYGGEHSARDFPRSMVDLKREQLSLRRLARELKQAAIQHMESEK